MEKLDFALFVAFWIAVFVDLDLWLKRPGRNSRLPIWVWALLFPVLLASCFVVETVDRYEREHLQHLVQGIAPTYAREMERLGHVRLPLDAKPDDPLYLTLIDAEKRWLKANPTVDDIYTIRRLPDGRFALLVDSETDYDRNGKIEGDREQRTPIGEIYTEMDTGFEKAFRGEANFDDVPTADRWGIWVTAAEPLYDEHGRVEAVLGVDYDAKNWKRSIQIHRWTAMGALSVLLGVIASSLSVITLLRFHIQGRIRAEEECKIAKHAAEGASAAKGEFLASMSHEIRTPLNGVIGMTHLLQKTPLSLEQKDLLVTLKDSAEFLTTLLNDILDFSKIEAGKMMIEEAPFDLKASVESICKSFMPQCMEKGIALECRVEAGASRIFLGDVYRLRQVLTNLLGNAIKFTEQGKVGVRVAFEEPGVRFAVWDTGIGIPKDRRNQVFEFFSQADTSTTRRYGGSGLGLPISSKLVFLMGGVLEVESEEGKGTTFTFTLPLHPAERRDLPQVDARPLESIRVLLGEDNPVNSRVVVGILEKAGLQVVTAENGRKLIEIWKSDPSFDVILMDVQMPEMDGLKATKIIRDAEKTAARRTPIIALTAYSQREDQERCFEAGVDAFLPKPIDPGELFTMLERFVVPPSTVDRERLRKRVGSDPLFLHEIVSIFQEETAKCIPLVREAIKAGKQEQLMRLAHALKGSVGNFCAPPVLEKASNFEALARKGDLAGAAALWTSLEKSLDGLIRDLRRIILEKPQAVLPPETGSPRGPS